MKRAHFALSLVFVVGVLVGGVSTSLVWAQNKAPVTRTELQRVPLESASGHEGVMFVADFVPDGVAGRHSHPGEEFLYVLQGGVVLEPDGGQAVEVKAGGTGHQPANHIHNVRNASATEPAKVLVFLISEQGQPLAKPAP
jgi:quercetin dioxygenase-like cupin family protein